MIMPVGELLLWNAFAQVKIFIFSHYKSDFVIFSGDQCRRDSWPGKEDADGNFPRRVWNRTRSQVHVNIYLDLICDQKFDHI